MALNLSGTSGITGAGIGTIGPSGSNITGVGTFTQVEIDDKIVHVGDTNTAIRFPAVDTITAETGGSERLRITSAGKIGIGENSPDEILHINSGTSNGCLKLESTDSQADLYIVDSGGQVAISANGDNLLFQNTGSQTERLRINSSGNMGLGETDISPVGGTYKAFDIAYKGSGLSGRTDNPTFNLRSNIYYDGSNWKYGEGSTTAGVLSVGGAQLVFEAAASGTAGATATITEKFRINADGVVTKPFHPAFKAGRSTNYLCAAADPIIFNDTTSTSCSHFNDGGHYNATNGRFTAPVAGVYFFYAIVVYMSLSDNQDMTDCFDIYRNASDHLAFSSRRAKYRTDYTGTSAYFTDTSTIVVKLAADDYVWIKNKRELNVHGNTTYCYFCGHLIG